MSYARQVGHAVHILLSLRLARRLLAGLDTPPSLAAAIRLDSWLRNETQANDTDRVLAKRI